MLHFMPNNVNNSLKKIFLLNFNIIQKYLEDLFFQLKRLLKEKNLVRTILKPIGLILVCVHQIILN